MARKTHGLPPVEVERDRISCWIKIARTRGQRTLKQESNWMTVFGLGNRDPKVAAQAVKHDGRSEGSLS